MGLRRRKRLKEKDDGTTPVPFAPPALVYCHVTGPVCPTAEAEMKPGTGSARAYVRPNARASTREESPGRHHTSQRTIQSNQA